MAWDVVGNIKGEDAAPVNLVPNPTFDADLTDWNYFGDSGWAWDGTTGRTTNGCLKLTVPGAYRGAQTDTPWPVEPGKTYFYSIWFKTDSLNNPTNIGLTSYPYNGGSELSGDSGFGARKVFGVSGSQDWTRLQSQYTVPATGVTHLTFYIDVTDAPTTGAVFFDDAFCGLAIDSNRVEGIEENKYYLGFKADDSQVVHKSGNESITGVKSFSAGGVEIDGTSGNAIKMHHDDTGVYDGVEISMWNTASALDGLAGGITLGTHLEDPAETASAALSAVTNTGSYIGNIVVFTLDNLQAAFYGEISMRDANKIIGLLPGTTGTDAVNKNQLDASIPTWNTIASKPAFIPDGADQNESRQKLRTSELVGGMSAATGWQVGAFARNAIYTHPESDRFVPIPHLFNDIAYNNILGGSVAVEYNGGSYLADGDNMAEMFTPDSSFATLPVTTAATDEYVVIITLPATIYYGYNFGIVMTEWCMAEEVTFEQFDGTTWDDAGWLGADWDGNSGLVWVGGDAGAGGVTKIRVTLKQFRGGDASNCRITQFFVCGYDSDLASGPFLPRGGGEVYGQITQTATPTAPDHLTRKGYVDTAVAAAGGAAAHPQNIFETADYIMTMPRSQSAHGVHDYDGLASGDIMLTYVYPTITRDINMLTVHSMDAGGAPTLLKLGVYSCAGDSTTDLTLEASTAHTPTLTTTAWSKHDVALDSTVTLTAGNVYAFALLLVTSNAIGAWRGSQILWDEGFLTPRVNGVYFTQTDLPSTMVGASVYANGGIVYMRGWES